MVYIIVKMLFHGAVNSHPIYRHVYEDADLEKVVRQYIKHYMCKNALDDSLLQYVLVQVGKQVSRQRTEDLAKIINNTEIPKNYLQFIFDGDTKSIYRIGTLIDHRTIHIGNLEKAIQKFIDMRIQEVYKQIDEQTIKDIVPACCFGFLTDPNHHELYEHKCREMGKYLSTKL